MSACGQYRSRNGHTNAYIFTDTYRARTLDGMLTGPKHGSQIASAWGWFDLRSLKEPTASGQTWAFMYQESGCRHDSKQRYFGRPFLPQLYALLFCVSELSWKVPMVHACPKDSQSVRHGGQQCGQTGCFLISSRHSCANCLLVHKFSAEGLPPPLCVPLMLHHTFLSLTLLIHSHSALCLPLDCLRRITSRAGGHNHHHISKQKNLSAARCL